MAYIPIIIGSPRKNGNTAILAREAARALTGEKNVCEEFFLNEISFSGCQACNACKQEEKTPCIINDGMKGIYEAIERADGIIVATPIYFGSVSGQTKNWLDRMFPYITYDLKSQLPGRIPLSCIYTQNQPDDSLFACSMDTFEFALHLIGFTIRNRMVAPDLDTGRKPCVDTYPDQMQKAFEIGRSLLSSTPQS